MQSGEIYRHDQFYRDSTTGELKPKYLVLLAPTPSNDWVARLLTSRANMRLEMPRCSLQYPYPGYFLGVPGMALPLKTWVDLRWMPDSDSLDAERLVRLGILQMVMELPKHTMASLLECVANADDTTRQQEKALRDQLGVIR